MAYHHGDLANALLEKASELLVQHGPAGLSLRQVAQALGVAPSAAYHHFTDKNALLDALAGRALDGLADLLRRKLARIADPRARLLLLARTYIGWARASPYEFEVVFGGQHARPDVETSTSPYELFTAILDDAVAAEILPAKGRARAETTLWPAMHGLAALGAVGPYRDLPEKELLVRSDDLVATVLAGVVARA